jgi:alkanesulfonate monooxygenase SsuD/methylene tetrahydromethanopterin reductase-like flavin-dependent oxidoreductase (luciferase family)
VWLTEHNFTGEAVYSDPIPFAAALAARTTRVRIGFAVIQLALRTPCAWPCSSRCSTTWRAGGSTWASGADRSTTSTSSSATACAATTRASAPPKALDVLIRAWTEAPLAFEGKYFRLWLPELRPRPYQRPHPPIWRSVVTPASFRECGRLGAPIMTPRIPIERIPERLALYEEGLDEGGHDASTRRRLRDQAAIWRHVYVGESQAEAEDTLHATVHHMREHMITRAPRTTRATFTWTRR